MTRAWIGLMAVGWGVGLAAGAVGEEAPQGAPGGSSAARVLKARIEPHWFAEGGRFWYRNDLANGAKEFILVNAEQGRRARAFDHEKLAGALSRAAGEEYSGERLPFDRIEFSVDADAVLFKVGEVTWRCDLSEYVCARGAATAALDEPEERDRDPDRRGGRRRGVGRRGGGDGGRSLDSPDGRWEAEIKDSNLFLRAKEGGEEFALSRDGEESNAYGRPAWSPDSRFVVAFRIEPGDRGEVHLVESSPDGGGRARLESRPYALPGDKFTAYEVNVFDVVERKQIKPDVDRVDFGFPRVRWHEDGGRFTYEKVDRGHQRFRLIEIDARTGSARNIIDEKTETFIWTAHVENVDLERVNWVGEDVIYASERSGWRQLYLVNGDSGEMNPITRGEFVVRGIDRIDEEERRIWFHACGKNPDQDPYFMHYYRVNLDGTGLVTLTEGNGTHSIEYSPDRRFLIDTYSRVDMAPVHELRRVSDGGLVCELERADIGGLLASGWESPEVFVAKGRDGVTDIWGIIVRPRDFDPTKTYPVIEDLYAGPHSAYVPKRFSSSDRYGDLTKLGFVVVKMDGMGTAHRSKAFHDVCWKNLKDAGFPDRILWHRAAAAKHPWYDLERVGVYGVSAGGQSSTGALLFHPEFYKVAVSGCGCHDNRMDKASWNEQWMGYPVGPQYAESSNIDQAHRLRGKLLLIVGELDTNVPPESTMRLVDALIKADKDFDLLVVPGAGHGIGGSYGRRRMHDFFVRHLLGEEPPDRNAAGGT